jgi:hypothetical protein
MRLTVARAHLDEVRTLLARVERFSASGELTNAMVAGCTLFKASDEAGVIRFAWAVEVLQRDGEKIYWCAAVATNLAGSDCLSLFVPVMEGQARAWGCTRAEFATRRRGLVQRMKADGYNVAFVKMGKAL